MGILQSIYHALKGLPRKLIRFIFRIPWLRKPAGPILPLQNPSPTTISSINEPLLVKTLVNISSSSTSNYHADEESQSSEYDYNPHVVVSIPDFTNPVAHTSWSDHQEITECYSEDEEKEKEIEKVVIIIKRSVMVGEEIRWIKHYSSCHRILVVGDGDFSFSASLAVAFGWAPNIIATSLDSEDFLKNNYHKSVSNIEELRRRNCIVMHEVDATNMAKSFLRHLSFDRIIFNFPFAGFFKDLPRQAQLRLHRTLVSQFMKNAKRMLSENGEIHISHKTNEFHDEWNLEYVAFSHKLRLIEAVRFNHYDYPGYRTKYGFGGDKNFYCNPSKTYKFGLGLVQY